MLAKRLFDIGVVLLLFPIYSPIILLVALCVVASSGLPAVFVSARVGKDEKVFKMFKFRTMEVNTPLLATDKLNSPEKYYTRFGRFLREKSLDELPQLWNVLAGNMSIVGPRPALPSQQGLLRKRKKNGVDLFKPGITGLAQVNGRDLMSDSEKTQYDREYVDNFSLKLDAFILWKTVKIVLKGTGFKQ